MRRLIVIMIVVTVCPAIAHAEDCLSLQTQSDMNQCVGQDLAKADAQLNALYSKIQQRLKSDPDTAKLMTAAQRGWVGYRDAECSFSSSVTKGGSIYPMIYGLCMTKMTAVRIKDFDRYLRCQDGDMECPVPAR